MALTVATNTGALMAQAAASSVNKEMEISMERLSTGKRINGAADDAAGIAIASRLTAEIKGTNMAIRNAMDGQAMVDTAEGAHSEIESILQRMRELAVQASNDTNSSDDRSAIDKEMDHAINEINRIAVATTWAGVDLLNGGQSSATPSTAKTDLVTLNFHVGAGTNGHTVNGAQDSIQVKIHSLTAKALGVESAGTTKPTALVDVGESNTTVTNMAVSQANGTITFTGALTTGDKMEVNIDGTAVDWTYTATSDKYADDLLGLTHQAADAINAKGIAGLSVAVDATNKKLTLTYGTGLDVSTAAKGAAAIATIDTAIKTLNTQRGELGSISNRLDHTVSNLTNISSNLQAGRGRIEDADFAAETTNLAKSQILQQASTAMLAQANASKQNVLSLLQG